MSGDAFLTTSVGQQIALSEGAILNPGNKIRTGQNGRVLLARGHETILIASNSVIGIPMRVTQGMSTTIYQWAGSILFAVEKRNHRHFEVDTPYLAAVVRGTRFRVTVNKDDAGVEVLRGQVEVTDFKSGQYALVSPGQAAKVFAQGSAGLSLNGSGTLDTVRQGVPRKPSLSPIALSDQRFSVQNGTPNERQAHVPRKAEDERVPSSSTDEDSRSSGLSALGQFFSNLDGQSDNNTIFVAFFFIAFFSGALGAAIGGAAGYWLRRRRMQKSIIVRVAGRVKS